MKIAIDTRWIFPEISGIGAYTRALVGELASLDHENQYVLLFDHPALQKRLHKELDLDRFAHIETVLLRDGLFSPQNQLRTPGVLKRLGIDVFHSSNYMIPLMTFPRNRRGRIGSVVTIHDVIPMIFPKHAPRSRKARLYPLYRALMVEVGRRADHIIADSTVSRRDVMHHLRIPDSRADRVHTIPCGVSDDYRLIPARSAKLAESPELRTILYVGRMDPYKNVDTLLRAFAVIKEQSSIPVELAIVGAPDPRYPHYPNLARELGIEASLHWTGYLSDKELLGLFGSADLLIHPSRYEGFGLQVAEAMAAGIPVISSTGGSLPEVAGDAALMVEPDDIQGYARHALDVLSSPDLWMKLSEAGRRQAAQFTWQRTAVETLKIYEACGAEG
ncbi:MAG: glycosyltransferase family 1 protein [Kiritimatiellia bacterium]|jgi:glycosyltransferase involved in cell wall biosynthesis|nr:glycosyltransferase family 1 protein [Kiritimatiellia bacterium]MDP6631016.1 glycosyltransferase family 1 protein [Kiritimatiellia bacterium]MDP6809972.1 glycosyltransferase family 1 protein [Kiritimatiellia bacterium]MDP7024743.1 glycosyltransferase family 1 protein [Kiritimatiellia bacterium]